MHCMLDLETLSTHSNAYIVAIGAVMFDSIEVTDARFYQPVLTIPEEDALKLGFHVSGATLRWWGQQSEAARAVFADPDAVPIDVALHNFARFCENYAEDASQLYMWGNGAGFDNVILANAYRVFEQTPPWMHYNDRCYRTAKNLFPGTKPAFTGTYHNALDDAVWQAQHLVQLNVI